MAMYKVGDIVRYAEKWCSPGEEKYIHIVLEIRDHSDDPQIGTCRYLIRTLNSSLHYFQPTETVDEEMIELI